MIADWVGWDSLTFGEQVAIKWYATVGGAGALALVMACRALFGGLGLKRVWAKAKKKRKKAKPKGRR